jgi:hypothetical protein
MVTAVFEHRPTPFPKYVAICVVTYFKYCRRLIGRLLRRANKKNSFKKMYFKNTFF